MTLATVIACLSFGLVASGLVVRVVDADSQDGSRQGLARDSNSRKRVIILCTGNSCRSQMAEAFWKKHGGDRWEVISAGTEPSGEINPLAVRAMAEVGIDLSGQESKSVVPFLAQPFDLAITVCSDAEQTCPRFPGATRHIHQGFDDPPRATGTDDDRMIVCRRVRDEIERKVKDWIAGT